jgi:uncharacterized phage-like protein YoqJ
MGLKVSGTGHRPDKLGGYTEEAFNKLVEVAENALTQLKPDEVISGMAMGWDMALAQAAINKEIPFIAAVPFIGQEKMWQKNTKDYYNELLSKAKEVVIVCEGGYSAYKMQVRNEWMVDNSDLVLVMHNGDTSGGTYNCVKYATKVGKQMVNLYSKLNLNKNE